MWNLVKHCQLNVTSNLASNSPLTRKLGWVKVVWSNGPVIDDHRYFSVEGDYRDIVVAAIVGGGEELDG